VEEVVKGDELAKEFGHEEDNDEDEEEIQVEEGDLDDILADMIKGSEKDIDDEEEEEHSDVSSDFGPTYEDEDEDDERGFRPKGRKDPWWERSSRFSQASMTSSVVPRSEQMATLDDRFEKVK